MADGQPINAQVSDTDTKVRATGKIQHQRESRWQIYLPFALAFIVIAVIFGTVIFLPQRIQVSLIADWLLIIFVLCPTVICLLPLVFAVVAAVYGVNRLHDSALPPLERLEELSGTMNKRVEEMAEKANTQVVNTNARIAPFLKWTRFLTDSPDGVGKPSTIDKAPDSSMKTQPRPPGEATISDTNTSQSPQSDSLR